MKLQHIAAALALVAAGTANAAIYSGAAGAANGNGDGSLFLIAFDKLEGTTTSGIFDLGYTLNSFATATGNGSTAQSGLGALAQNNTKVVWNFLSNTVTLNGSEVTSLGTNDWSSAYTKLLANVDAGDFQWVVGANDVVGFGAAKRFLATGSTELTPQQLTSQSAGATNNLGLIVGPYNNIFTSIAGKGSIDSADNGAFTFTAADGDSATKADGYVMAGNGFGNNWRNANLIGGTKYVWEENGLWLLDASGAEQLIGTLKFDTAAGTLTFTSPVPEASTYAMALVGLGMVGLMARRRRA